MFEGHVGRIFMRVTMESDFVACITDSGAVFGKSLEGVAYGMESGSCRWNLRVRAFTWDEPCCFDVVLFEELQ